MKSAFKLWGIIVLVTVFGFAAIGCNNDSTNTNPFMGNWTGTDPFGDSTFKLTVTATNWIIYYPGTGTTHNGTYTYTGNTITFSGTIFGSGMNGTGKVSGNTLTINAFFDGEYVSMKLTRS